MSPLPSCLTLSFPVDLGDRASAQAEVVAGLHFLPLPLRAYAAHQLALCIGIGSVHSHPSEN